MTLSHRAETAKPEDALVELRTTVMQFAPRFEWMSNEPAAKMRSAWADNITHAILPIIRARDAAARGEGRREGIEEAAAIVKSHADVLNNTPKVLLGLSVTQAKLRLLDWLYAAIRALAEKQP